MVDGILFVACGFVRSLNTPSPLWLVGMSGVADKISQQQLLVGAKFRVWLRLPVAPNNLLYRVSRQVELSRYLPDLLLVPVVRSTNLTNGFHYQHLFSTAPLSGSFRKNALICGGRSIMDADYGLKWGNFACRLTPYLRVVTLEGKDVASNLCGHTTSGLLPVFTSSRPSRHPGLPPRDMLSPLPGRCGLSASPGPGGSKS